MTRRIGRFEVRSELGRGGQSTVYLGFDPQLEREIAIKTVHLAAPGAEQNRILLEEARLVSQLRHPNIVPIFEAGEQGGDLYLVFEYVPGRSLAALLRAGGALSPVRSVMLLRPVLDAIEHAHGQGIIHRDLKPSNILLDDSGVPHVMDFGIAARIGERNESLGGYTGTPAYMAPEYIERREVGPRADVFAAGLVLYEMLSGERAARGDNLFQIIHQIANVDIRLPEAACVDEQLAGILYKALARDPDLRYQSARQFAEALDAYLEPAGDGAQTWGAKQSTLDFLFRRMRYKSDFPALSESIGAINRIAGSQTDNLNQLSRAILKDFALTSKLLRLANSAAFRPAGGGPVGTVSGALMLLGLEAVMNVAITVHLFEHLQNKANARLLKEEFLRANLAASLARCVAAAAKARDLEQTFICALFHNLGRLLAQYYFPEEAEDIRRLMERKNCAEEEASVQVLGISLAEMGVAIARQWGFPALIAGSMRALPPGPVKPPDTPEERLQQFAGLADELCTVIALAKPEERDAELDRIVARFAEAIALDRREIEPMMGRAVEEVSEFARIIQLDLRQTVLGRQMRQFLSAIEHETPPENAAGDEPPDGERDAQAILTAGIQATSNTLVDGYKLNDVLRSVLDTMYRAMGFKRVVLCIRDARSGAMQGVFGVGADASEVARAFRFALTDRPDIFCQATARGEDILIGDIDAPANIARIPDWYRKAVPARSCALFPLNIKGKPVALIYADRDEPNGVSISEKELSLLRALRNQAVLAIKQGG